jgi:hypothetical protein
MIRFLCPSCKSLLECADAKAGTKVGCPRCHQRLQVPVPPKVEAPGRTVLGSLVPAFVELKPKAPPPGALPRAEEAIPEVLPVAPRAKTRKKRRGREDDQVPPRRVGRFHCPYCSSERPPEVHTEVSTGGWIVFVLLFLGVCSALFCWIGLLMRRPYRVCSDCGIRIG